MLRIEFISEGTQVKTAVDIEGKGSDIVDEVLCFHNDHVDILKEITDKLPSNVKLKVLMMLLEQHFDVSEGDDEK